MMVNIMQIKNMGMESLNGKVETRMLVSIKMMKEMAMVL